MRVFAQVKGKSKHIMLHAEFDEQEMVHLVKHLDAADPDTDRGIDVTMEFVDKTTEAYRSMQT